jgi:predicted RND superfamily exporter protein
MFREAQLVTRYPKLVVVMSIVVTLGLGLFIPRIKIDTDPENMLSEENPVRVFHHEVKEHFGMNDLLVLGIIRQDGVYQKDTLERANRITEKILTIDGVIAEDVMSFLTTDNVVSGGGMLNIHRIADEVPEDPDEIEKIRRSVNGNKFLVDKLASHDGKGLAIYIPIVKKSESYRIAQEIEEIIAREGGDEEYHLAGLPVAEDTFGFEMFKQMAISAPLAGLFIFLMMWWFFRRISLIISPMIVAGMSVVATMGLLIGMGYTVHIMSSMIPIFLMPIAVVDSVHILSVFHDWYPRYRDKQKTMSAVVKELFTPMLYTSITSAVGFASLALTPIPPVRVFGLFVAFGILLAWALTVTFIPAYVMLLDDKKLGRGLETHTTSPTTLLTKILGWMGRVSTTRFHLVLMLGGLLIALSIWGITRIVINDNPVKWFKEGAKIRVADTVMNEHFGG